MYGGGKNYCLINNNMTNKEDYSNITINLSDLKADNSVDDHLIKLLKYATFFN